MNLNTIRLEGKMETDEFYDLADEQGVLIMAGWCCCDHWELWKHWQPGDLEIASASLRSQILRIERNKLAESFYFFCIGNANLGDGKVWRQDERTV
jgi:beta-galactosidase/beta-glucuronidase